MIGSRRRAGQPERTDTLHQSLDMNEINLDKLLHRIADALDRQAPPTAEVEDLDDKADAFIWHAEGERLEAVVARLAALAGFG